MATNIGNPANPANLYGRRYASTDAIAAVGTEFRRLRDLEDAAKGPTLVNMTDEDFRLRVKRTAQNWDAVKNAMNQRVTTVVQNQAVLDREREEHKKFTNFDEYSITLVSRDPFNGIRNGPLDQTKEVLQAKLQQIFNVPPLSAAESRPFRPRKLDLGTHMERQLMGVLYSMNGYESEALFLRIRQLFVMCERLLGHRNVSLATPGDLRQMLSTRVAGSGTDIEAIQDKNERIRVLLEEKETWTTKISTAEENLAEAKAEISRLKETPDDYEVVKSQAARYLAEVESLKEEKTNLLSELSTERGIRIAANNDATKAEKEKTEQVKKVQVEADRYGRCLVLAVRAWKDRTEAVSAKESEMEVKDNEIWWNQKEIERLKIEVEKWISKCDTAEWDKLTAEEERDGAMMETSDTAQDMKTEIQRHIREKRKFSRQLDQANKQKETLEQELQELREEEVADLKSEVERLDGLVKICEKDEKNAEAERDFFKDQLSGWSNGVRVLVRDSLEAGKDIGRVLTILTDDLPAIVERYELTQKGDLAGSQPNPIPLKYMATDFVIPLEIGPKSFLTLLKWDCHADIMSLDDLIVIQKNWLKYGYLPYGEDTAWILLSVQSYLEHSLERACKDKLGVRAVLTLSLLWQMQTVFDQSYNLQNVTALGSFVTKVALSGFPGFVMATRVCKMYGFWPQFETLPEYSTQFRNTNHNMQYWMETVPGEGVFPNALYSPPLLDLRKQWSSWMFSEVDATTGWTLTIVWERKADSWFKDVKMSFLQKPDGTILFNSGIHVFTDDRYNARIVLRKGDESGGFVADASNIILRQWVLRFCAQAVMKAYENTSERLQKARIEKEMLDRSGVVLVEGRAEGTRQIKSEGEDASMSGV